ncbi:male-specific histamine-binding salivary protein-like [Ixodes scapularis]|uniref:male-specific histamine-binding salivary protein-like n=1 Tax=Ixodes scapularis TaxID=6945 RepID=UPI001A9F813D|nr:male-specific histamine-binding salivary protein-like [Ixodes scapularis]
MAVRISTLLCFMAAAIIQLPEAHSRTTQPTRYDAARELREQFDPRYYLIQRSQRTDRKLGNDATCVSVLELIPVYGEFSILANFSIQQSSAIDPTTNITVIMTAYTPDQSPIRNMIETLDAATYGLVYNQKLVFSDYRSCRVLTYEDQGDINCELWMINSAARGSIPQNCSLAYDRYCKTKHYIFDTDCLPK